MKNFKSNMQSFGKSLLFPISLLSFMAIFLGIAAAFQNKEIIAVLPFLEHSWIQDGLGLIRKLAGLPFANLPVLFALAIPYGMVKRDKEVAVFSALVGYLAFLIGMNYILSLQGLSAETTTITALMEQGYSQIDATIHNAMYTNALGYFVYNTNVIGGILVGLSMVWIHNKFRATELPAALSFYSGKRFVPIISAILLAIVGIVVTYLWPLINSLIISAGEVISNSGVFGAFIYGFMEKIINPTGLHHILNQTFRFTALGGVESIDGENVVGALNIFLKQLDLGLPFSPAATQYLAQGKILHMVFGMPGAVFAIYKMSNPEKRKKVLRFFIPGLTAVILTGITEPIEFTFIFISPILWVMNAVFAGLAFLVPAVLNVTIGNIQGGVIDWLVFGVLQGMETKWWIYLIAGPLFFALYYFSYKFVIGKFNVLTLGRSASDFEDEEDGGDGSIQVSETAAFIIDGLGGMDNIIDVDNCISRLRVEVKDSALINENLIKKTSPNGIIKPDDHNIHIVYGGRITNIRNLVDDYMYNNKQKKKLEERQKTIEIHSPVAGKVLDIDQTPDPVFADKMMGDGVVVFPTDSTIYAPVDGKIKVLFPTKHAIGIELSNGIELLIHIGIDTVNLKGEGFTSFVQENDYVVQGDKLITFDPDIIKKAKSDAIPVLITNLESRVITKNLNKKQVNTSDIIFEINE